MSTLRDIQPIFCGRPGALLRDMTEVNTEADLDASTGSVPHILLRRVTILPFEQ